MLKSSVGVWFNKLLQLPHRYKLLRADAIDDLVADFYSYAGVHRDSGIAVRACQTNDEALFNALAEAPSLPLELLSGNTATDRGGTVLHWATLPANTMPPALLEKVLLHTTSLNKLWDADGRSPFSFATTEDRQQILHPGDELLVLETLYRVTQGPTKWNRSWGTPDYPWQGITLPYGKQITKLDVSDLGLEGGWYNIVPVISVSFSPRR